MIDDNCEDKYWIDKDDKKKLWEVKELWDHSKLCNDFWKVDWWVSSLLDYYLLVEIIDESVWLWKNIWMSLISEADWWDSLLWKVQFESLLARASLCDKHKKSLT